MPAVAPTTQVALRANKQPNSTKQQTKSQIHRENSIVNIRMEISEIDTKK